jgi:site-specific recombinase XerD
MKKAGIDMKGQKCGLHTLRNTLAKVMLENGATLPVISETLGHQKIQTTSIYLKIDIGAYFWEHGGPNHLRYILVHIEMKKNF